MQHYGLQSNTMAPTTHQVRAGVHEAHTQILSNRVTNSITPPVSCLIRYTSSSMSNMNPFTSLDHVFMHQLLLRLHILSPGSSSQAGFLGLALECVRHSPPLSTGGLEGSAAKYFWFSGRVGCWQRLKGVAAFSFFVSACFVLFLR